MSVLSFQLLSSLMFSIIKSDICSTLSPPITSSRKPKSSSGAVSSECQLLLSLTSTIPSTQSSSKLEPTSTQPCSTFPWRRTKRALPKPPRRQRQSPSSLATSKSRLRTRKQLSNKRPLSPKTTRRRSRAYLKNQRLSLSMQTKPLSVLSSKKTIPAISISSSWPELATLE